MSNLNVVLALALAVIAADSIADFGGRVVNVHDGDTLTVLVDRTQVRIRLVEIDAPELGQPFGNSSKQSLSDLCIGKSAEVVDKGKDQYGRTLGWVKCAGVDVNSEQIRRGMAWVYDQYVRDRSLYNLQAQAKNTQRGLWSDRQPVPPWDWRKSTKGGR